VRVGVAYSRIRTDEKLLLSELRERGHEVSKVDVRERSFGVDGSPAALAELDLLVDRCLATSRSTYLARFCERYGLPVVNPAAVAATCADKVETSLALADAGVPTPETAVAFTVEQALALADELGYPCVLKPVVGSWGRLVSKLESRAAAETVLEHKEALGHYEHSVFYLQAHVDKPGRDVRVLAADGEPVAAMTRSADAFRTNAAQGAETAPFDVDDDAAAVVAAASDAVGGGLLGVDLLETADGDYVCPEVNHTPEFAALSDAVDADVAAAVVDWLEAVAAAGGVGVGASAGVAG